MGMLDIFFFAKEMLFGCWRILRSSDFLRFISERTCPQERQHGVLLRKSVLSLKTLMLSLDSTVSCVTLMMLGDLSGPQLPLLKC